MLAVPTKEELYKIMEDAKNDPNTGKYVKYKEGDDKVPPLRKIK